MIRRLHAYTPQAVHALRALLEQFEQTVGGAA